MGKRAVPAELSEYFAKIGRKGGRKGGSIRAANMTAEERSESARRAVQARWAKKKRLSGDEVGASHKARRAQETAR